MNNKIYGILLLSAIALIIIIGICLLIGVKHTLIILALTLVFSAAIITGLNLLNS